MIRQHHWRSQQKQDAAQCPGQQCRLAAHLSMPCNKNENIVILIYFDNYNQPCTVCSAGVVQLNEAAMQQLQRQGYDRDLVLESLLAGDCNSATAAYHLMQQALTLKQEAAYSNMHLQQQLRQPGDHANPQAEHGVKRIDTPLRLMRRSQSAQPGIQAYRPSHVTLEVEGVSAGCDKGHRQHAAHVSDDSAQALHQTAVRTEC